MADVAIKVVNAQQNNLKGFSVEIPFGSLVCITGVSGSGKSTLIEHCIAELAQRRHLALSGRPSTHFYEHDLNRNSVPFVSYIKQGTLSVSNRSIVGTALGFIQKLRPLIISYAEVRDQQGRVLEPITATQLARWCQRHYSKANLSLAICLEHMVLGPAARYITPAMQHFPTAVFKVVEASTPFEQTDLQRAEKYIKSVFRSHKDIYAVIPSLSSTSPEALIMAFNQARLNYSHHDLILIVQHENDTLLINLSDALLSLDEACVYYKPSETLLSFNSKALSSGKCPVCQGTGEHKFTSPSAIFNENAEPITKGGLLLKFNAKTGEYFYFTALCDEIRGVLKSHSASLTSGWSDLPETVKQILAYGSTKSYQPLTNSGKPTGKPKPFVGILTRVAHKIDGHSSASLALKHLSIDQACQSCKGTRFNYVARAIYFMDKAYTELLALSISDTQSWLYGLLSNKDLKADHHIISTLEAICQNCIDVGIGHLQLNRATNTLSGGEAQRLRIARYLWGGRLDNACYILDEPTRGLHTVDTLRITYVLDRLRSAQNCILLVEHNPIMIAQADRVLELGPHGGFNGGQLIYDGTPQNYPMRHIAGTPSSSPVSKPLIGWITVKNASLHTVIRQSFKLPLGHMTCFTGVSGSGKTTLLAGILLPALEQLQKGLGYVSSKVGEVACVGVGTFKLIYLPQSAIGGSYRSRVLTYIGLADSFREWFFQHSEAIESGLTISDFSANTLEGQCLTCEGLGRITSSSGSHEKCPSCCGSGFKPESTFVHTQNMSIEQWMECIFSDLAQNEGIPVQLRVAAELAIDLELGHLSLGRSIPTLSGGECQRLRIIKALLEARPRKNSAAQQHLIIIMDEPAAGLHAKDVQKLTKALKTHITDKGHTLLLVEHNLDLISQADWIVEVGPGSAAKGGKVLFADSMEKFFKATLPDSPTHSVLKDKLKCKSIGLLSKTIANAPTSTPDLVNMIKAVDRFKHYIKGESEEQDEFNPVIQPIAPAYLLNPNEFANQTLAHVIGLDASLARLFSVASSCEQQPILTDLTMLTNQALQLLKQGWRIGWFPSLNGHELTTWPDVVKAIQYHLQQKQEWFDGKQITIKSPKISEVKDINKVRLLLTSQLDKDEAVRRAISLGKGWVSFVSLETDEIRELSVRAIDSQHLRLGSRWQVPQIFDSAFIQNACPLCDGRGKMESVNEQLIFKDKSKSLEDDQLFQPYALEILKLARRRDMLPAAKRLKECRLIDLMAPQESMLPTEALAFWFGYPYKSFLKSDGDKNIRSNWYHWIGINKTVLLGMWKCSSRAWAEKVNSSRTEVKCPQCQGSGLGWEAQARKLSGVSLQDIYLNYTGLQLGSWLKKLQLESNMATQAQQEVLDVLSLIVKMTNKNFRLFELLSNLPEALQKAALNIYISNNKLNKAMVFMN